MPGKEKYIVAKVTAPLFSFTASGKLADSLVFMSWKGLNTVRKYVIPANPKSDDQITQRAYMKAIVPGIHKAQIRDTHPLNTTDYAAYSALAAKLGKVMTWFNMICKLALDGMRIDDGWTVCSGGGLDDADKDDFRPMISFTDNTVVQVQDGKFYLGTSPTNLLKSEVATVVVGGGAMLINNAGFSGLVAGTKYYWQFRPDALDPCEGADSGIYSALAT
ncbi:hypothetical protein ES703_51654 [subsurface metagenome]